MIASVVILITGEPGDIDSVAVLLLIAQVIDLVNKYLPPMLAIVSHQLVNWVTAFFTPSPSFHLLVNTEDIATIELLLRIPNGHRLLDFDDALVRARSNPLTINGEL